MEKILYKTESYKIVGLCMTLHRELGPGFLEGVYQEALEILLTQSMIPFEREKELSIQFMGKKLEKTYFADFICYDEIILELKAVSKLSKIHEAQVFNYLKATEMRLGILVNFGEESLKYKRIII